MKPGWPVFIRLTLAAIMLALGNLASAQQFYFGAQVTNISAELDYGATESYDLNPVRIELGWQEDWYYWGFHALTSGSDTDIDFLGDTYEMELDTSFGIFVGGRFGYTRNFYAAIGMQSFDTTYRFVPGGPADQDNILTLGMLAGGQFQVSPHMYLYADISMYFGTASYPVYFFGDPDFSAFGFAAGAKFAF